LFFIFQEIETVASNRITLKSILKNTNNNGENKNLEEDNNRKSTKKVQIQIGLDKNHEPNNLHMNKTQKKYRRKN
jgi:hypothetical protein